MATIKRVNPLDERRGLRLAERLVEEDGGVTAVSWWADPEDAGPRLLVGFLRFREEGPRRAIDRLSDVLAALSVEAPDFLDIDVVPGEDPRLQALLAHPWAAVPLDAPNLTHRFVSVWSRKAGAGQALVYFLRAGDEVRVPLPPALSTAA